MSTSPSSPRLRGAARALLALGLLVSVGCSATPPLVASLAAPTGAPPVAAVPPVVDEPPAPRQADVPAGRIVYVRDGNLWIWERGTGRQLSQGGTWRQPAFSPDGKEIAYVYWWENFSDIFVMSSDGTQTRRLTRGAASFLPDNSWAFRPSWSPDGSRLAYVSDANSTYPQLWLMAADGGNRRQITSSALGLEWVDSLSWDRDGGRLAITAAPSMRDPSAIYTIDVARGTAERLAAESQGAYDPAWSPASDAIAYVGRTGGRSELVVRSGDGNRTARIGKLPFVRSPVWSPDGKHVAVLAAPGGTFQVWVLSVAETVDGYDLGEPKQLTTEGTVDSMSGLTWAR